jgi:hypothetical protein
MVIYLAIPRKSAILEIMATVSKTLEKAIQKSLPGWKVLKKAGTDGASTRDDATPDAFSPTLDAVKAKYFGKTTKTAKRLKSTKKHAQFVIITPTKLPDNAKAFRKVVLVKDNKVVAVQG